MCCVCVICDLSACECVCMRECVHVHVCGVCAGVRLEKVLL